MTRVAAAVGCVAVVDGAAAAVLSDDLAAVADGVAVAGTVGMAVLSADVGGLAAAVKVAAVTWALVAQAEPEQEPAVWAGMPWLWAGSDGLTARFLPEEKCVLEAGQARCLFVYD